MSESIMERDSFFAKPLPEPIRFSLNSDMFQDSHRWLELLKRFKVALDKKEIFTYQGEPYVIESVSTHEILLCQYLEIIARQVVLCESKQPDLKLEQAVITEGVLGNKVGRFASEIKEKLPGILQIPHSVLFGEENTL